MTAKLQINGIGSVWKWSIDRYVRDTAARHIELGDTVLYWQPAFNRTAPAGIYAYGEVYQAPIHSPNVKSNWQVDVQVVTILSSPISLDTIRDDPALRSMLIVKMPNHIVFPVTTTEWAAIQHLQQALGV